MEPRFRLFLPCIVKLDICLVIHAEHGGGNNSSFTTHVVSSTLTDTYSVMAAAIGSLKGPRHGGANIKVVQMFEDIQDNVRDWTDADEVGVYLKKLLDIFFDNIYKHINSTLL